ncbi:MAG: 30S ribosomal protein S4 [Clostridia bacterium]|nr:30S ribosomal protein S4 [Clostridia bacterium]
MARYTGAVCRLCRREGMKLFLKGDRCYSDKCSLSQRQYAPGQHGQGRKKLSEYGLQLREKQKAKRYYGVLEKQFRHYFELAEKKQGITGENLLGILETRLDNVAYRLGFGTSRAEARQIVRHGHVTVNGRRVNIPSYLVSVGDVIAVAEKSKGADSMKAILESTSGKATPKWLDLNKDTAEAKVIAAPARDDIDIEIAEHLIVELYSK